MLISTTSNGWVLQTHHTGYAFGTNPAGLLAHTYWGERLPNVQDYPHPRLPQDYPFNPAAHRTL